MPRCDVDEQPVDMTISLHRGDLPDGLDLGDVVAVDSETMGLQPDRDRLCVVQLSAGDGAAHLVQLAPGDYAAPNLRRLLADPARLKLFHYARFDLARAAPLPGRRLPPGLLHQDRLQAGAHLHRPARAQGPRARAAGHRARQDRAELGLGRREPRARPSCAMPPAMCSTCTRCAPGSTRMLAREGRADLAQACFDFLPVRAELDLAGWPDQDLFAH